ncbi:N-acetyl-D-glucosamine ABC transport system [Gracilibacillus boraciitolerans JCM 21714]|uniref:N-acetyl-D-glucosamine ABC transport system n=1 Tax=Gracilibacillus boraciitolerans JCM 21714 TaxID=1298598 RepID=W4VNJ2_9BACI|nr:extracellular solute-binding protein [Gracilibacillus boraciitolerans]GAE94736.1 N-acetyl-D-glucosamine ABC transport system [Gracilibacillus boraciitolerans JCM 21714]
MKRWILTLLAFGGIFLFVTACSNSENSDSESEEGSDVEVPKGGATEIVMWNLFSGGDAEYMQNMVDKFNEDQSEFFVNNIMQEHSEYYTKLLTSIGAGQGPDVAISHDYILPELVNQGLAVDLGDIASEVGIAWDEFNSNILEATIFDDQHYAVPIDTHAQIMYINNELVGNAGLLNDDGTIKMENSMEGYLEFFHTLKENLPEGGNMPFAFSNSGNDPYWFWWGGLYSQLGGRGITTEDNLENPSYDLDTEKAIQAAEFVQSLYHEEEIIPLNIEDFYSEFQSGNAATITTGVWATGIWEKTDGLDFTPMPIPRIFEQKGVWGKLSYFDYALL